MKHITDANDVPIMARRKPNKRDDRPVHSAPGRKYQDAVNRHFKRETYTAVTVDRAGHCQLVERTRLIPWTTHDELAEYGQDRAPVKPITGGPRAAIWPAQSGAAQSPYTGRDRRYPVASVPARNVPVTECQSLIPPCRVVTGRASVSDSPRATIKPRASLRFASEARRDRLSAGLGTVTLNTEEGVTERAPQHEPDIKPSVDTLNPDYIERVRIAREKRQAAIIKATEDETRRLALRQAPPAPKCLPRPARKGAPTPRHGIEGARSASGRDLDPGRKR